jgi:hypothetical protein
MVTELATATTVADRRPATTHVDLLRSLTTGYDTQLTHPAGEGAVEMRQREPLVTRALAG